MPDLLNLLLPYIRALGQPRSHDWYICTPRPPERAIVAFIRPSFSASCLARPGTSYTAVSQLIVGGEVMEFAHLMKSASSELEALIGGVAAAAGLLGPDVA